jgi:hypothetical protein
MSKLVICAFCRCEIPPVLGAAVDVGAGLMHRACAVAYENQETERLYLKDIRAQKAARAMRWRQRGKGIIDPDYRDGRFRAAAVCLTPGCNAPPYREKNGRTKGRCRACRSAMERQRRAQLRARQQNAVMT